MKEKQYIFIKIPKEDTKNNFTILWMEKQSKYPL